MIWLNLGYKAGMLRGFAYIRATLNVPVDLEYLCVLHDTCIDGVTTFQYVPGCYGGMNLPIKKGLYDKESKNQFGFLPQKISRLALVELEEEKLICFDLSDEETAMQYLASYDSSFDAYKKTLFPHFKKKNGIEKAQAICNRYREEIAIARTENEKLEAIAKFCRALEIYHLFFDGNQRTIAFLLLNKLLIENGFSPGILEDPYILDGYHSLQELIEDFQQAMRNFKAYRK